jgi:hypothetical protein
MRHTHINLAVPTLSATQQLQILYRYILVSDSPEFNSPDISQHRIFCDIMIYIATYHFWLVTIYSCQQTQYIADPIYSESYTATLPTTHIMYRSHSPRLPATHNQLTTMKTHGDLGSFHPWHIHLVPHSPFPLTSHSKQLYNYTGTIYCGLHRGCAVAGDPLVLLEIVLLIVLWVVPLIELRVALMGAFVVELWVVVVVQLRVLLLVALMSAVWVQLLVQPYYMRAWLNHSVSVWHGYSLYKGFPQAFYT